MIERLEINSAHTNLNSDIKKYVRKKIGKLDKYLPRRARASAHAEVKLKEHKIKAKKECTCEVILHLPQDTLIVKETTMNMFAAVDIVEAKLKNQLKKYKEKHSRVRIHHRVLAQLRRGRI